MKPAAARLLLFNNAGAYRRAVGIVAGVALGTGMLLILLGTYLHMPDRDNRIAWQESAGDDRAYSDGGPAPVAPTDDAVLFLTRLDYFDGKTLEIAKVAWTPHTTVDFPAGIEPPAPGEYYASPAMAALIDATPADQLGDRYGTRVGLLPDTMLKGPNQLVVFGGAEWDALARDYGANLQERFGSAGDHVPSIMYRTVLAVGSVTILVPIVLLISIVAQLGAAERRERLATVRLIGAGRRAVAALAGFEMAAASLVGALAGIGVAAALRPAAAQLSINRTTSFSADLVPSAGWTAVSVVAITLLGAVAAWWRTFRDDVGALGATRERPEKPVTVRRALPLALGIAIFGGAAWLAGKGGGDTLAVLGFVVGFGLTAFGVIVAGSWLTKVASRAYGKLARSASSVVAAGRLARHPRATFRSVAGVVIAVFIVSFLSGVISSVERLVGVTDTPGLLSQDAVMAAVDYPGQADGMAAAAREADGVSDVVVAYQTEGGRQIVTADEARALGAVDVPSSPYVTVNLYEMLSGDLFGDEVIVPEVESAQAPQGAEADYVVAITDGSVGAVERARTALIRGGGPSLSPTTRVDYAGLGTLEVTQELSVLAYIGMAIAIAISALALTVATVAAALDRKRTFGLLRLGGMPVSDLRKSVTSEAALPLASTLVASAALGFLVAWIMLHAIGGALTMTWPDPRYWWAILGALAIAAVAIAGSFGVVRRSTELASTRFE